MLTFKKVEIDDLSIIKNAVLLSNSLLSDTSLGAIFLWRKHLKIEYSTCFDGIILRIGIGNAFNYLPPFVSSENIADAYTKIEEFERKNSSNIIRLYAVNEDDLEYLKSRYSNIEYSFDEKWSDYIYDANSLATFVGRKYNGQRNFTNRFKKTYPNYVLKEICNDNIAEIKNFLSNYYQKTKKDAVLFNEEKVRVSEILDNFNDFSFFGLLIKVDGNIVAMAIGEKKKDVLFIHIEKANTEYVGAYQMIVNEFAKRYSGDVKYINREDAAGDIGLITSKKSYHPIFMGNKNKVIIKDF